VPGEAHGDNRKRTAAAADGQSGWGTGYPIGIPTIRRAKADREHIDDFDGVTRGAPAEPGEDDSGGFIHRGPELRVHGIPAGLTLIDSAISTTGVFIGTYVPAGEIAIGSSALDPTS